MIARRFRFMVAPGRCPVCDQFLEVIYDKTAIIYRMNIGYNSDFVLMDITTTSLAASGLPIALV